MFPHGSIEYWQDVVIRRLPPVDQVLARNYRLTAQYARWYQAHPDLFKWAGMASFSSRQVGIALTPYQMVVDVVQGIHDLENGPGPAGGNAGQIIDILNPDIELPQKAQILPGLNMLRETNNAVFLDIGWAHEAYVQEGINAVETAIKAKPEFRALKDGFRQIEAGRQLQVGGQADAARERIWSGNLKLLEHEQRDIVQKQVARATVLFDTFLSATTEIRYWANPFHIHPTKMTVFSLAMLVFNLPFLITHNFVPNFSDIDHRWEWIVKRVIPIFQRLDGSDPEIMSSIAEIIATGSQVLMPLAHTPGTVPMAPPG